MVYPTLFPTDHGASGYFLAQGKKRVFRTHAEGLNSLLFMGDYEPIFYANIKRTANGERKKENVKKVLITENKPNGVGLDIVRLMAYND